MKKILMLAGVLVTLGGVAPQAASAQCYPVYDYYPRYHVHYYQPAPIWHHHHRHYPRYWVRGDFHRRRYWY